MPSEIKVLFLGDVVGKAGRKAVEQFIRTVDADFKIINGENLAGGIGITPSLAADILSLGVDIITTGNHVWKKRDIVPYLMEEQRLIRPLNYPPGTPGFGYTVCRKGGKALAVANIEGRVFMNPIDCPFRAMEKLISERDGDIPLIVDFHAEATSEKIAMGWFLDGKAAALFGTHTHVQTADERILPNGTGYITDVGMTGPADSVIGMEKTSILKKFISQLPQKFEGGKDDVQVQGVLVVLEATGNRCVRIDRIRAKIEPA
jgi:2',3'-cyclic-nucleotide 2'-phosphodiesterase